MISPGPKETASLPPNSSLIIRGEFHNSHTQVNDCPSWKRLPSFNVFARSFSFQISYGETNEGKKNVGIFLLWHEINMNTYPLFSSSHRCLLETSVFVCQRGAFRAGMLSGQNSAQEPIVKLKAQEKEQDLLIFGEHPKVLIWREWHSLAWKTVFFSLPEGQRSCKEPHRTLLLPLPHSWTLYSLPLASWCEAEAQMILHPFWVLELLKNCQSTGIPRIRHILWSLPIILRGLTVPPPPPNQRTQILGIWGLEALFEGRCSGACAL